MTNRRSKTWILFLSLSLTGVYAKNPGSGDDPPPDEQWEEIIVTGHKDLNDNGGWFYIGTSDGGQSGSVSWPSADAPDGSNLTQANIIDKAARDIRCYSAEASRDTVSTADQDVKDGLAQSIASAFAAVPTNTFGKTFTVTWADNGTSTYQVINPTKNGQVHLAIIPTSQTDGNGQVQPGPVCGKG